MNSVADLGHVIKTEENTFQLKVDVKLDVPLMVAGDGDMFKLMIPENYHSRFSNELDNFGIIMLRYFSSKIYIELFMLQINLPEKRQFASEDEIKSFKGIGKKFLCLALRHLATLYPTINPDTGIFLSAGGVTNLCNVALYEKFSTIELIDKIKTNYVMLLKVINFGILDVEISYTEKMLFITALRRFLDVIKKTSGDKSVYYRVLHGIVVENQQFIRRAFLVKLICEFESNEMLVNYYRSAYGFRTIEEEYEETDTKMESKFGIVIGNCE